MIEDNPGRTKNRKKLMNPHVVKLLKTTKYTVRENVPFLRVPNELH